MTEKYLYKIKAGETYRDLAVHLFYSQGRSYLKQIVDKNIKSKYIQTGKEISWVDHLADLIKEDLIKPNEIVLVRELGYYNEKLRYRLDKGDNPTEYIYQLKDKIDYMSIAEHIIKEDATSRHYSDKKERRWVLEKILPNKVWIRRVAEALRNDLNARANLTAGKSVILARDISYYTSAFGAGTTVKATPQNSRQQTKQAAKKSTPPPKKKTQTTTPEKTIVHNESKKSVVIDPGHGGVDPGTIFPHSGFSKNKLKRGEKPTYTEKEIARKLGKHLKELLDKAGTHDSYSTRNLDQDSFVDDYDGDKKVGHATASERKNKKYSKPTKDQTESLQDRVAFANSRTPKPSLYISIHVNAIANENEKMGMNCYVLNEKNTGSIEFTNILKKKLIDGNSDYYAYGDFLRYKNLYVLRKTKMPAALLEIGFISAEQDRKIMTDDNHLKKIAKSLKEAIDEYLS